MERTRKVEDFTNMFGRGSIMDSIAAAMANRRIDIANEYDSDGDYDSDDSDF